MTPTNTVLVMALAIGLTASCAYVPRLPTESPETSNRRTQYLHDHPHGPYNAAIMRGEVVKGMHVMDVVASWGIPERRAGKKSALEERWTYTARDEHSRDYVVYELVFVDRVLTGWQIDRETSGSGVRAVDSTTRNGELPFVPVRDAFGGDGLAPKK